MSGTRLRCTILAILIVALLLPLASAYAAPVRQSEAAFRLADWSRILLQPVSGLLSFLRSVAEASSMPPGQKPGNDMPGGPPPTGQAREGNGIDPHGGRP
jgi:hypothetical protein